MEKYSIETPFLFTTKL